MKKSLFIFIVILFGFLCVLNASATGKQEQPRAERKLVIYNSYMGDPEPRRVDKELIAKFMEKNPEVRVIHSIVAHEDFKQAIRAYLTASTPPDVMTWFCWKSGPIFHRERSDSGYKRRLETGGMEPILSKGIPCNELR